MIFLAFLVLVAGGVPKGFLRGSLDELRAGSSLLAKLGLDSLGRRHDVSVLFSILASPRLGSLVLIDLFGERTFGLINRLFFGVEGVIDVIF